MSSIEKILFLGKIYLASAILSLVSCGLKGPPLPPEEAPVLGRGSPSANRDANQKIKREDALRRVGGSATEIPEGSKATGNSKGGKSKNQEP